MNAEQDWADRAKGVLKAEIKRRNLTYADLAHRLAEIGIRETPENIGNKIARGRFTFAFALQCFCALNCRSISIDEV